MYDHVGVYAQSNASEHRGIGVRETRSTIEQRRKVLFSQSHSLIYHQESVDEDGDQCFANRLFDVLIDFYGTHTRPRVTGRRHSFYGRSSLDCGRGGAASQCSAVQRFGVEK